MEAVLGAADFGADEAERYGWVNPALPDAEPDAFVARLARRIASFPAEAVRSTKRVLNDLTLPEADAIRADARRFHQLVGSDTVKARTAATLFASSGMCTPTVTGRNRPGPEPVRGDDHPLPRGPKMPVWNRRPGACGR